MFDFATEVDQLVAEGRAPEVSTSGTLVRVVGLTLVSTGHPEGRWIWVVPSPAMRTSRRADPS